VRLSEIHQEYRDRVTFYSIYVREAHPMDGWMSQPNVDAGICYMQPKTLDERSAVARDFIRNTGFSIPLLLDTLDNATGERYAGLPDRLVVIDADGLVAYPGKVGPHGMDPDEWLAAIRDQVG
jgi:hypothetical protein